MTYTGGTPHKTHVIITILALIILAGILGFFAYQQNPQLFSWLSQPSQKEAVDTATWQTYRNKEYGFELRVPKDYSFFQNGQSEIVFSRHGVRVALADDFIVRIHSSDQDWLVSSPEETILSKSNFVVDGVSGLKITVITPNVSLSRSAIFVPKQDKIYKFGGSIDDPVSMAMIRTFKFIR